jgi:inhibitor of cysteine peptidase
VTARIVDPLFAINVSDPLHPRILGYLKAPGFDAYLHPINETVLLGVGYENSSLRVSLYRITPNGTPVVLDRLYLGHALSPVLSMRGGSRAFLYVPEKSLALIPYTIAKAVPGEAGVFLVEVNGSKLVLAGKLVHMKGPVYPLLIRAVVIGEYAYTVIPAPPPEAPTVRAWSLDTLKPVASAP